MGTRLWQADLERVNPGWSSRFRGVVGELGNTQCTRTVPSLQSPDAGGLRTPPGPSSRRSCVVVYQIHVRNALHTPNAPCTNAELPDTSHKPQVTSARTPFTVVACPLHVFLFPEPLVPCLASCSDLGHDRVVCGGSTSILMHWATKCLGNDSPPLRVHRRLAAEWVASHWNRPGHPFSSICTPGTLDISMRRTTDLERAVAPPRHSLTSNMNLSRPSSRRPCHLRNPPSSIFSHV
jgi:hypothetical protein